MFCGVGCISCGDVYCCVEVSGAMADFLPALRAEIEQLQRELDDDPRALKLRELRRLLAIYEESQGSMPSPVIANAPKSDRSRRATSATRRAAIDAARIFLRGRPEPTKTSDIYAHIKALGIEVGGENPQNNLSAMLHHSPEFISHGRGGWRLRTTTDELRERGIIPSHAVVVGDAPPPEPAPLDDESFQ